MLGAIGYVALSTKERPFASINRHINPVLGWGWAIATLMANLVWAMPQFSLGTAALQQNLLPGVFGESSGDPSGQITAVVVLFAAAAIVVWFYDSGGWGIRLFEILLKGMVGVIVASFFGVVVAMSLNGGLDWERSCPVSCRTSSCCTNRPTASPRSCRGQARRSIGTIRFSLRNAIGWSLRRQPPSEST